MITFGTLGPRPLEIVGVADPLETLIRHVSSSVALRQTVSTYTRSQHLGTASLDGAWFTRRNMPFPHFTLPNVHSRSNGKRLFMDIHWKNVDSSRPAFQGHSRSLEPTWNDRLPMTSY